MITTRFAVKSDTDFWFSLDAHLQMDELKRKIRDNMAYIIEENGEPIGIMRYNLFWDSIPFLTLIYLRGDKRGIGAGRTAVERWESDMKKANYGLLMTSTQADEQAQYFYRKLGFKDIGGLVFDIPDYEQPLEIMLAKRI
ncbi:MAG: GNAT family N-acetyltransferase [Eubacteriales bacterium]|nr:GNAT family N-acetyltransferase [Eubacteriales bacterium]MDD3882668.1 GNAT family N-acetyltransferase [Eubacteriales bacterium]MDD4512760.1 GNAT family N-acetyltransferase [Eubacteriales bacterium]